MRLIAFLCGILALSACAHTENTITRNSDLPGIQTSINCSPEPTLIYSKTGQLIETIVPVLHPSCAAASGANAAGPALDGGQSNVTMAAARAPGTFFFFGPATYTYTSPLEASDDDAVTTALAVPAAVVPTATPTTGATTSTTTPTTPTTLSKLDQLKQHAGVPF